MIHEAICSVRTLARPSCDAPTKRRACSRERACVRALRAIPSHRHGLSLAVKAAAISTPVTIQRTALVTECSGLPVKRRPGSVATPSYPGLKWRSMGGLPVKWNEWT